LQENSKKRQKFKTSPRPSTIQTPTRLKLKTSRRLLELADEFYKKYEELRTLENDWVTHSDNPESKEYTN